MRIDLSDGSSWVDVREPPEVSERLRRPHLAASAAVSLLDDFEQRVAMVRRANDLGVLAIVAAWSWPDAVSEQALLDMPSSRYDEIMSVTESRRAGLRWSLVADEAAIADPKAPSDDSNSSEPGWATPTP